MAQESLPGFEVVCPFDFDNTYIDRIPPRYDLRGLSARSNTQPKTADIEVKYNGFTEEAQTAFQYAVDIWSTLIKSNVKIRVTADFVSFDNENTIGSAGPTTFRRFFDHSPDDNWYPIALAEKIARKNLNIEGNADITARFSRDFDFYFGLDGNTPSSKTDFVSIVLHELGHGLGFVDLCSVSGGGEGSCGSDGSLDAYSNFLVNSEGRTVKSFENPSAALGSFLTSNDVYCRGPEAAGANDKVFPRVYAPLSWAASSSIAHWNEDTYPPNDENTLMTPFIGSGQSAHDPGPITMSLFTDMGWTHSWIVHSPSFSVNSFTEEISLEVTIQSDTLLESIEPMVYYSFDGFITSESKSLISVDEQSGLYSISIDNPGEISTMDYYFSGVIDVLDREYRSPGAGENNEFYTLLIGEFVFASLPYTNDLETNGHDFVPLNRAGTPFELGSSLMLKKNGTNSGDFAWVTGLDEPEYQNESEAELLSPLFDFSLLGNYELTFQTKYSFEPNWDGFIVQYSTDLGKTWIKLQDDLGDDWYDDISDINSVFGPRVNIFTGSTEDEFVTKRADLSFLGGDKAVWLKLLFLTDEAEVDAGMVIDDFVITSPAEGPAIPDFEVENLSGCEGQILTFVNKSAGSITSMNWDFGLGADPQYATGVGPHQVTYSESQASMVTLTVEDSQGNSSDIQKIVETSPLHVPEFEVEYDEVLRNFQLTATDGDSYQWYKDNEPIVGAIQRELKVSVSDIGLYQVGIKIDYCYVLSDIVNLRDFIVLSSRHSYKEELVIYPSPASDFIMISGIDLADCSIELVDFTGKKFSDIAGLTKNVIPITNLESGIYILSITNDGGDVFQRKIIVE